ncbi:hypothetical protein Gocc_0498 [Gaiella occulta]|uniref:Uncharacterized protein n=1 Tax=Gaiella occulta TaxID=1002870 RepID=A0A7M2Z1S6_9ACTN|nr:hypothetical protein Gocc_0498 [Gaiella occulta]
MPSHNRGMAKLLIHRTKGPEDPTRAALGFEPDGLAEAASPAKLVELTFEHDRVLTY